MNKQPQQPLLRDRLDGFGKSLFDAADVDAPKPGSTDALLLALGVGVGVATLTATASTAAAATTATAATATTATAATATATATTTATAGTTAAAALTAKSVAAVITKAILVAAVATGGAVAVERAVDSKSRSSKPRPTTSSVAVPMPAVPAINTPPINTDGEKNAPAALTPHALPDAPKPQGTAAAVAPTPTPSPSPLGDQVGLVDEARTKLHQGDPAAALDATRRFEQRFGAKSALSPEAMLVAVQAHLARGDEKSARVVEATLRQHHPSSPATRRATELLEAHSGK